MRPWPMPWPNFGRPTSTSSWIARRECRWPATLPSVASDFVVIPLEAADWGARGTAAVRTIIELVQRHDNPRLKLLGYVVSKYKRARAFQIAYLAQIRQAFGEQAFETVIPDLAQFERSVDEGIPITLHSPHCHAADIARQFFDEFAARISQEHDRSRGRKGANRPESQPAVRV